MDNSGASEPEPRVGGLCSFASPHTSEAEIAQQVASTQQAKATQNSVETLVALVTELSNQPTWTPQPACPVCPTQLWLCQPRNNPQP